MTDVPILYSFRRCPYAMRARMALWIAGITVELREVKLADKPPELVEASPKATVPVLVLPDGSVVDESIAIMRWALNRNDPENWLNGDIPALIERNDGPFKHHLDRYKYATRYEDEDNLEEVDHRAEGRAVLADLDARLADSDNLHDDQRRLVDVALFPFIRQFANTDREWFDAQELPRLQGWLDRHLTSDLFKSVMPKFQPWKAGDDPILFGASER